MRNAPFMREAGILATRTIAQSTFALAARRLAPRNLPSHVSTRRSRLRPIESRCIHTILATPSPTTQIITEDDPFASVRILLSHDQRSYSLDRLLVVIPESAFFDPEITWDRAILKGLLKRRRSDLPDLLRLVPVIIHFIQTSDASSGALIARHLLRQIREGRHLALLGVAMDALIIRLEMAVMDGEMQSAEVMREVGLSLDELRGFRITTAIGEKSDEPDDAVHVPPIVDSHILRLATLAINIAESSPSTSNSPNLISHHTRRRLFSRAILTPTLRRVLLAHIPEKELTGPEARACALNILEERRQGMEAGVDKFLVLARGAEEKVEKKAGGSTMTERSSEKMALRIEKEEGVLEEQIPQVGSISSRAIHSQSIMKAIDQIICARCGRSTQSLMQYLEPYLNMPEHPTLDSVRPYAWSILLHRLSHAPHTASNDLIDIADDIPEDLTIPHVLTPIITGLIARGDLQEAWGIWTHLSDQQKASHEPRRFVDAPLLAAVTPLCAQLHGLPAAVQLVDEWARRPTRTDAERRYRQKINNPSNTAPIWRNNITLDAVNINVLIHQYLRRDKPSVPLRIFEFARDRWGVWPDAISLGLLLDCCRFDRSSEPQTIRSRLRDLVGDMRLFKPEETTGPDYTAYDSAGFSKGDHRVLLDPEGAEWRDMMGDMRPWEVARQTFRNVIFGNWPHLANIKSPLEFGTFARLDDILAEQPSPLPGELRLPLPTARYTHIIPTASTFQSYVTLLGYHNRAEEIPVALAWAREIGVEPNWKSMTSALAYIGDVEGPRRRVRGWTDVKSAFVRDEEIMRRWLEEWVQGKVPTEIQVAAFVKKVQDKGGKMTAGTGWGQAE